MRLVLVVFETTQSRVKCFCGRNATTQLEVEHNQSADPVAFFCDECADELAQAYHIPKMTMKLKEIV